MKKTEVHFEQVRDCPHWLNGECIHFGNIGSICVLDELGAPPSYCPCEEVV